MSTASIPRWTGRDENRSKANVRISTRSFAAWIVLLAALALAGCGARGGSIESAAAPAAGPAPVQAVGQIDVRLSYAATGAVDARGATDREVVPGIPSNAASFEIHVLDAQGQDVVPVVTAIRKNGVSFQIVSIPSVPEGTWTVLVIMLDAAGQTLGYAAPTATVGSQATGVTVSSTSDLRTIAVFPASTTIAAGANQGFTATATFSDNSTAPVTMLATWTTATPSVATISSTGAATAIAAGTTTIAAKWQGQAASATLTVEAGPAPSPPWGTTSDLSPVGQTAYDPQIALSSDGTKATAVWCRSDGTKRIVQTAFATISGNTATWSTVTSLSAAGQDSFVPQIALSSDGTKATAVWLRSDGVKLIVQTASATISGNTATWSAVTELSAASNSANSPQIAMSSDGTKATVVWSWMGATQYIVQTASATISGNTATWSAATDLTVDGLIAVYPQIGLSSDGTKATATWYRSDGASYIVQAASASISGNTATWSAATNLSAAGQNAWYPQVALSSDGMKATAVWHRSDGANNIIQAASATISGNTATWSAATDLSAAGQNAAFPQITLSSDGTKATAVWHRSNGTNTIVQAASAAVNGNTATWSAATDLSAAGQDARKPQIALSSDGTKATAVWLRSNGTNDIVQAVSYQSP